MMCVDVSVNRLTYIGGIFIRRLNDVPPDGMCDYIIEEPKGPWNETVIKHHRDFGWFPLLLKACKLMEKHGFETPHKK